MDERRINILLTSFEGLGLPRTLSLQTSRDPTVADINDMLLERIPSMAVDASLILTTSSNRKLEPDSMLPLASFLDQESDLLPIRLSVPLVGRKDFPDDHPANDANNAAADTSAAQLDQNAAGAPEPPAEDNDSVVGNAGSDAGGSDAGSDAGGSDGGDGDGGGE